MSTIFQCDQDRSQYHCRSCKIQLMSFLWILIKIHIVYRIIRITSPSLNNIIILGALINYLSVFMYGVNEADISKNAMIALCHVSIQQNLHLNARVQFKYIYFCNRFMKNPYVSSDITKSMSLCCLLAIDFPIIWSWAISWTHNALLSLLRLTVEDTNVAHWK